MTPDEVEAPMPPAEWLAKHTGIGSKGSAGFGWRAGWAAGFAAAKQQADIELEDLRYERRLLGAARMLLDHIAESDYDVYPAEQAADLAQRIVDEIGHPVTDEPALGPSFREQLAEAQRREELMRPVVEKAIALVPELVQWYGSENADALVAAVDTYETQTGGTE